MSYLYDCAVLRLENAQSLLDKMGATNVEWNSAAFDVAQAFQLFVKDQLCKWGWPYPPTESFRDLIILLEQGGVLFANKDELLRCTDMLQNWSQSYTEGIEFYAERFDIIKAVEIVKKARYCIYACDDHTTGIDADIMSKLGEAIDRFTSSEVSAILKSYKCLIPDKNMSRIAQLACVVCSVPDWYDMEAYVLTHLIYTNYQNTASTAPVENLLAWLVHSDLGEKVLCALVKYITDNLKAPMWLLTNQEYIQRLAVLRLATEFRFNEYVSLDTFIGYCVRYLDERKFRLTVSEYGSVKVTDVKEYCDSNKTSGILWDTKSYTVRLVVMSFLEDAHLPVVTAVERVIALLPDTLEDLSSLQSAVTNTLDNIKAVDLAPVSKELMKTAIEHLKSYGVTDVGTVKDVVGQLSARALTTPANVRAEIDRVLSPRSKV